MEFIRPEECYLDEYLAACRESIDHNITEWIPIFRVQEFRNGAGESVCPEILNSQ